MVHVFACVKTSLWGTVFRLFGLSNEKGKSILIIDNFLRFRIQFAPWGNMAQIVIISRIGQWFQIKILSSYVLCLL